MQKSWNQILALGGVAGPLVFIINTQVWGRLRPNYDQSVQFISELGATGTLNAQYMNYFGFIPSGILLSMFGIALFSQFPKQPVSRAGALLITLFGAGIVLAGFFSCDQGCPVQGSRESMLHNQISAAAFVSSIIGLVLVGSSFIRRRQLRRLGVYTMVSALMAATFLLLMINSVDSRHITGTWQRLLLLALFQWMAFVGWHMYSSKTADFRQL